jgi:hypothetical protein
MIFFLRSNEYAFMPLHYPVQRHRNPLSVRRIPSGRPKGSGTFESRERLLRAVATANRTLREQGKTITQPAVADLLHVTTRRLQQLIPDGMTWDELKEL